MRKLFFILSFVFSLIHMSVSYAQAQQGKIVEFWRITKVCEKDGKITYANGVRGLFITRVNNMCYDSDANGLSLGRGTLTFYSNSNGVVNYYGSGSFGNNCLYSFSDSDGYMNIRDASNNVFVFVRSDIQTGKSATILPNTQTLLGSYQQPPSATVNVPSSSTESTSKYVKPKDFECPYCRGTGKVKISIETSNFGVKSEYWTCPECGERSLTHHRHVSCTHCHGTGRINYN